MSTCVNIFLKSGNTVLIEDFQHITYPGANTSQTIEKNFDNFYLYDRLLTFVGRTTIVSIHSHDIEYVTFEGQFKD